MQAGDPRPSLPATEQLLVAGGDARIALDPASDANKYGCPPHPDPELAAFGSSTASVISEDGFAAADRLRDRLLGATTSAMRALAGARELERIRREIVHLCGVSDLPGLETVFASSGTDLHSLAAQLAGGTKEKPALAIMAEASETGSGVAAALTASGRMQIASVPLRLEDGTPRRPVDVDAEVETLVATAVAQGRRILLILIDVSKTGMIAPSPACVVKLHARHPESLDVLVDACQFRISASTLRAYLERGFMVGLTGSKFVTGPSFSGLLLIPSATAPRQRSPFRRPTLLSPKQEPAHANFGLLLRWEAALAELRAFRALPENAVGGFLQTFAQAVRDRLSGDPAFELLPTPPLDRHPLSETAGWDAIQTIFPFLLYRHDSHDGRIALNREETARVSRLLPLDLGFSGSTALRCQLGQPVACGTRNGMPVSALRLCVGARLVVEAAQSEESATAVIRRAMAALDNAAYLAEHGMGE